MPDTTNPLKQYFRKPAIYVRLPSNGQHYPPGSINMPPNNELPVYPMTAVDEITSRTPDALFNGSAMVEIIKSCVPDILDPWNIPQQDIDTLLIAVRIASYGHTMDIDTTCPSCKEESNFGLDLRTVLDSFEPVDYSTLLNLGDLQVKFRPLSYVMLNENSKTQFEDQKILQILEDAEMDQADKVKKMTEAFMHITDVTIKSLTQNIEYVSTPESRVSHAQHIEEWLRNSPKEIFERVRDHAIALRAKTELKPLKINCPKCQKEFDQPFTMDMSNFFGSSS